MKKNKNNMYCIAKKDYHCLCCGKKIAKGSEYYRVNINFEGVFHFCDDECKDKYFYGELPYDMEGELC